MASTRPASKDALKIGEIYGNWEIVGEGFKRNTNWYFPAKCSCGTKITNQQKSKLLHLKCNPCKHCCNVNKQKPIENGDIFGKRKIIDNTIVSIKNRLSIKCECQCGRIDMMAISDLIDNIRVKCKECFLQTKRISVFHHIFNQLSQSAKKRDIVVNITVEDLINQWEKQKGICALSKVKLILAEGYIEQHIERKTTASVDRIDSNKEYTIDNIQFVHKDVNRMKSNFTEEKLIRLCKQIYEEYQWANYDAS